MFVDGEHAARRVACARVFSAFFSEREGRRDERVWTGRLGPSAAVGAREDLEQVTVRIVEVDASAVIPAVDLIGLPSTRVGPMQEIALSDAREDRVEFELRHEKRVMLRNDGAVGLHVIERHLVADPDYGERAQDDRGRKTEHLAQKDCRSVSVARCDDGVVEAGGHANSSKLQSLRRKWPARALHAKQLTKHVPSGAEDARTIRVAGAPGRGNDVELPGWWLEAPLLTRLRTDWADEGRGVKPIFPAAICLEVSAGLARWNVVTWQLTPPLLGVVCFMHSAVWRFRAGAEAFEAQSTAMAGARITSWRAASPPSRHA